MASLHNLRTTAATRLMTISWHSIELYSSHMTPLQLLGAIKASQRSCGEGTVVALQKEAFRTSEASATMPT